MSALVAGIFVGLVFGGLIVNAFMPDAKDIAAECRERGRVQQVVHRTTPAFALRPFVVCRDGTVHEVKR